MPVKPLPALLSAAWISLAACSAMHGKEDLLPQAGPTMLETYRAHLVGGQSSEWPRPGGPAPDPRDREAQGPKAQGGLGAEFKRLPNPDLVMYVYPHLSAGSGYPVPGYSTVLPMYEHVEYALPGEAEGWE